MNRPVMVIDDSPTICKIIEVCLGREGFEVKTFSDGVEALCWLHDNPAMPAPALAFIDLNLPKMDGYAVARCLKARAGLHDLVIVIISRRSGVLDHVKARLVGASNYIAKPFTTQVIIAVTRFHLFQSW